MVESESDITLTGVVRGWAIVYFYDDAENVVKRYNSTSVTLETTTDYYARKGRGAIEFLYRTQRRTRHKD